MQLVLDTNGLIVKKRNRAFWIISKQHRRQISPHRITSIAVTADCLFSAAAIRLAAKHRIPIFFLDRAGRTEAKLWSSQFGSIASIRRAQVLFALEPEATAWIISLFHLKLTHQLQTLTYLQQRRPGRKQHIAKTKGLLKGQASAFDDCLEKALQSQRATLMGIEGAMARLYWQEVAACLPPELTFARRSRRPATDAFNAALNYLYGMLYSVVTSATFAAGLDPYLGFLHADQYQKPTLVFDMIEPFRPWVDRLLLEMCWQKAWTPALSEAKDGGIWIAKTGKQVLIPRFNQWLQQRKLFQEKRLSHKNQIYRFAGEFAQSLIARDG